MRIPDNIVPKTASMGILPKVGDIVKIIKLDRGDDIVMKEDVGREFRVDVLREGPTPWISPKNNDFFDFDGNENVWLELKPTKTKRMSEPSRFVRADKRGVIWDYSDKTAAWEPSMFDVGEKHEITADSLEKKLRKEMEDNPIPLAPSWDNTPGAIVSVELQDVVSYTQHTEDDEATVQIELFVDFLGWSDTFMMLGLDVGTVTHFTVTRTEYNWSRMDRVNFGEFKVGENVTVADLWERIKEGIIETSQGGDAS